MTTLTTARLVLRPLVAADAPAYAAMRCHPDVTRWLPPAAGTPLEIAARNIESFRQLWALDGHAPWGLFLRQPDERAGRLIGQGGLRIIPEFAATELLYALHPDVWGQGYATEMGEAALRFGFESRGLGSIFAITVPDNVASQAVMRRLGMSWRRNAVYKNIEVVWLEIEADLWRQQRKGAP